MLELILNMLVALDDFTENDLKFSKKDIDNFIQRYNVLDRIYCNERGFIVLFNNKYISSDKFCELMECEYKDGYFYLTFDHFEDFLNNEYEIEARMLDGEYDWYHDRYYDADVEYYWSYYTEETLKKIIKFCDVKGLEYNEELMTKENMKIKENGKLYFNDEEVEKIIREDDLEELYDILNRSILDAEDTAQQDGIYTEIKNNFENKIGKIERFNVQEKNKTVEKIRIKLDIDLSEIEEQLKSWYGDYEFEKEDFGNLYHILNEMDYFEFKKPNYDYISYSIDNEILNEYTIDRLNEEI